MDDALDADAAAVDDDDDDDDLLSDAGVLDEAVMLPDGWLLDGELAAADGVVLVDDADVVRFVVVG